MKIGANYLGDKRCEFVVWAPFLEKVVLSIISLTGTNDSPLLIPMDKGYDGYWKKVVENISPGTLYLYRIGEGWDRPDPASHYQPGGVHNPSQVVDHKSFKWEDNSWRGIALSQMIIYEIHTGTFTPEGTFESIIP